VLCPRAVAKVGDVGAYRVTGEKTNNRTKADGGNGKGNFMICHRDPRRYSIKGDGVRSVTIHLLRAPARALLARPRHFWARARRSENRRAYQIARKR